MCGIVGLVGPLADTQQGADWVDSALVRLAVRGPDASALWRDDGVILGHRRLAIRDLSEAGAQPMTSGSGRAVVAYNGEIYEVDRLAAPLRSTGWQPRGHSDTEVVLERLERAGLSADPAGTRRELAELNGMFAIALWDKEHRSLLLARDRVGIKPLYVAILDDGLAFCSEPGPLYDLVGLDRTIDPEALTLYLTLGVMPAPYSMARSVRQLLPGESLWWGAGRVAERSYFAQMPVPSRPNYDPADPCTQEELEALLVEVVADQLVSDVPVGVLLSGGVDSSLVAAAAARAGGRVKTFSIVHADPAYDERESARAVAERIGSDHHELELQPGGLTQQDLEALVHRTGDPFADTSALAMRRVSALVRDHVTVALSGDGGDELFAGYTRYHLSTRLAKLGLLPAPLRRGAVSAWSALDRVAPSLARQTHVRQAARAALVTTRTPGDQAFGTKTFMWPAELQAVLLPHVRTNFDLDDLVRARVGHVPAHPDPWFLHTLEQRTVLPDQMCVKVDRMSMTESLEIRPCLLDNRVIAAAARTPFRDKYGGGEGKAVLKRIARRWVPPEIVDRPKKGFAVPVLAYGGAVLEDAARWALTGDDSPLRQLFSPDTLASFHGELKSPPPGRSPEDSAFRLTHRRWMLVMLAMSMRNLRIEARP